jgi:hypothetical protein
MNTDEGEGKIESVFVLWGYGEIHDKNLVDSSCASHRQGVSAVPRILNINTRVFHTSTAMFSKCPRNIFL